MEILRRAPRRLVMVVFGLILCVLPRIAQADIITFANATRIVIPDMGMANPYPTSINVSGVSNRVVNIQIGLLGLSHSYPNDLAAVVVSPGGTAAMLFSGPGGNVRATNIDLLFDDNAPTQIQQDGALVSGTYKPGMEEYDDVFPDPGPGGKPDDDSPPPWHFSFRPWLTENMNGRWDLFLIDGQEGDRGSINRGWTVTIEVVPEPSSLAIGLVAVVGLACRRRRL